MLNAFRHLLCSLLCQHIRRVLIYITLRYIHGLNVSATVFHKIRLRKTDRCISIKIVHSACSSKQIIFDNIGLS